MYDVRVNDKELHRVSKSSHLSFQRCVYFVNRQKLEMRETCASKFRTLYSSAKILKIG